VPAMAVKMIVLGMARITRSRTTAATRCHHSAIGRPSASTGPAAARARGIWARGDHGPPSVPRCVGGGRKGAEGGAGGGGGYSSDGGCPGGGYCGVVGGGYWGDGYWGDGYWGDGYWGGTGYGGDGYWGGEPGAGGDGEDAGGGGSEEPPSLSSAGASSGMGMVSVRMGGRGMAPTRPDNLRTGAVQVRKDLLR
jgi:hypothetical protein